MLCNAMLTISLHNIDHETLEIALRRTQLTTHDKKPLARRPAGTTSPDIDNHLQTTMHY